LTYPLFCVIPRLVEQYLQNLQSLIYYTKSGAISSMINPKLIKTKFKKYYTIVISMLVTFSIVFTNVTSLNLSIGSPAQAAASDNFNSLYTGSVIMLRNAMSNKLLNIAEGPVGPYVVWSPETAEQNHDNTIVVLKKEGTNIVMLMNRYTRKVLGVNKSGLLESKLEVQTPTYLFDQYQSFYVDYLPNGNVYFSSVAFPERVVHLPYGGNRNDFVHFTLHDKSNLSNTLQVQFVVDLQGDGANTSFGEEPSVVLEVPTPEATYEESQPEVVAQQPTQPTQPTQQTPKVEIQIDKLRTGAVVVLRNADLNQPVNIRNLANGQPINGSPAQGAVDDEMILVAVNKPNTNIYQFFNRKNGKVLSVSTGGKVGNWVEVWNRVPGFNPYQSFYIDTLPNGNMVLSPVAFPSLALNLPEGGRSTTYQRYTLWSKEDIGNAPNRQFKVEVLGYGADTAMPQTPTVNKPTTVTQFQSSQGAVKLVNNNPVGVVGATSNNKNINWNDFNGILDEPLRKDPVLMAYYQKLPAVKKVDTIGNFCPEVGRGEFSDNNGSNWITHINLCGRVYTYLNKNAMIDTKYRALTLSGTSTLAGGTVGLLTAGVLSIPFAYPTVAYLKLSGELSSCLDKGATGAWMDEYGTGSAFMPLSCSF
jgi:hypothetical protein